MTEFFRNLLGDSVNTIAANGTAAATDYLAKEAEDSFGLNPALLTSQSIPAQVQNTPSPSVPLASGASGAVSPQAGITTEQQMMPSLMDKAKDFYANNKTLVKVAVALVVVLVVVKYAKK